MQDFCEYFFKRMKIFFDNETVIVYCVEKYICLFFNSPIIYIMHIFAFSTKLHDSQMHTWQKCKTTWMWFYLKEPPYMEGFLWLIRLWIYYRLQCMWGINPNESEPYIRVVPICSWVVVNWSKLCWYWNADHSWKHQQNNPVWNTL